MLRCARCGDEVSEWAARCPACGHGTEDAHSTEPARAAPNPATPAAPAGPGAGPGRDPAAAGTTPDPPGPIPEPLAPATDAGSRRAKVKTAAAVTAAVMIAGTLLGVRLVADGSGPAAHGAAFSLPRAAAAGRIVTQDPQGTIVLADPGGGHVTPLPGLDSFGGEVITASLDRRFVANLQGAVLPVDTVGAQVRFLIPTVVPKAALLGGPDTFTDYNQALILVTSGEQQQRAGALFAVGFTGQRPVSLGVADEAAGDPQALGVFVSVAAATHPNQPPPGGYAGLADSRIEMRDASAAPQVLATAAQLNADLHQDPARPVHLSVFPSPSGDAVAVELNPPAGGGTDVGIVVLDRRGQVRGIVKSSQGPFEYSWPSWSPDGHSLAYSTVGTTGTALAVWNDGGHVLIRTAPDNGARFGYCVWAPDGSAILCPTFASARDAWDQGAARGGPLFSVPAPGTPVVWLPPAPQG